MFLEPHLGAPSSRNTSLNLLYTLLTYVCSWQVAEEDEATDEAVIGHDALADLDLLVDCKRQQLISRSTLG